jgi:hypothetical protein
MRGTTYEMSVLMSRASRMQALRKGSEAALRLSAVRSAVTTAAAISARARRWMMEFLARK